mmetsp:Transcript_37098/g.119549  ORF Transcript_37098/g.119549 Transcript_37098/m.119549 type:complete len:280 (-) Transcript_37098:124-963(-)
MSNRMLSFSANWLRSSMTKFPMEGSGIVGNALPRFGWRSSPPHAISKNKKHAWGGLNLAITLAIAKAKAAALMTCSGEGPPGLAPLSQPSAIDRVTALLSQPTLPAQVRLNSGLVPPAQVRLSQPFFPGLRPPGVIGGANPGLFPAMGPAPLQAGLASLPARPPWGTITGPKAAPFLVRPPVKMIPPGGLQPMSPGFVGGCAGSGIVSKSISGVPFGATAKPGLGMTHAPVGLGLGVLAGRPPVPSRTTTATNATGFGSFDAMNEVSPALAALMQGGLV